MTRAEFERDFKVTFDVIRPNTLELDAVSRVVRISNDVTIARVRTIIDILDTQAWIRNSQTQTSLIPWNWDKVIERTKRAHLEHFAREFPIDGFFPLDLDTAIDHLYS